MWRYFGSLQWVVTHNHVGLQGIRWYHRYYRGLWPYWRDMGQDGDVEVAVVAMTMTMMMVVVVGGMYPSAHQTASVVDRCKYHSAQQAGNFDDSYCQSVVFGP